jgi:serine/threonine protein kinase
MLGKGHDGMCYLCEDLENRELVAVKVLNPKRNRKVTEPVLMAGLDHKHIIRMRDHFMVRGFNFLVIDYCDKGDLCDYVYENEYLDEAEARKILLQLVKGVRYLHDRGICHRDLKLVRADRANASRNPD